MESLGGDFGGNLDILGEQHEVAGVDNKSKCEVSIALATLDACTKKDFSLVC